MPGLSPADAAAAALVHTWAYLSSTLEPPGETIETEGATAFVTGVPIAAMNMVVVHGPTDPARVGSLLDAVAAPGVPYSLHLRPGLPAPARVEIEDRGLVRMADVPLMVLGGADALTAPPPPERLTIRVLTPAEAPLSVGVMAAAFEAPPELVGRVLAPPLLAGAHTRCYLGQVDGRAVATGTAVTLGGHVAVFNVATLAEHRRRGYGTAVTVRALEDGWTLGASSALLQSSPSGAGLYAALGFRRVEDWALWATA